MTKGEFRSQPPQTEGSRNTEHMSPPIQPHITEETHQLKTAMVWGPVGTEMYLASLYPNETSHFLSKRLDVEKARDETHGLVKAMEEEGVKVIRARDVLVQLEREYQEAHDHPFPYTADYIYSKLVEKAYMIEQVVGGSSGNNHEQILAELLERDIQRYGREALPLAYRLSLNPHGTMPERYQEAGSLPLGNVVYTCDQMKIVGDVRIQSSMRYPIRKGEIDLFEAVYGSLGVNKKIILPEGETFEGGDLYIHNGIVFIGVGARTSFGAAESIAQQLRDTLEEHALSIAAVVDTNTGNKSHKHEHDMMHLDTWSQTLDPETVILYPPEAKQRLVVEFSYDTDGNVVRKLTDRNYIEYLESKGTEVFGLSTDEQAEFAFNNLSINEQTVLVANGNNEGLMRVLENRHKEAKPLEIGELMGGYGAAHCMTAQLIREKV